MAWHRRLKILPSSILSAPIFLRVRGGQPQPAIAMAQAAAAVSRAAAAVAAVGGRPQPQPLPARLPSSLLPPFRLPLHPCSSLAGGAARRPLHVLVTAQNVPLATPEPPRTPGHIWLSNVVPLWRKPYFVNRKWALIDIGMAGFLVVMHGLCLLAPFTFSWQAFGVFLLSYLVTGMLGITLSFHRNLSHKSFILPKWLEYTFAYCGVLAMQGDPLEWVSSHRYHHQYCDTDKDPHSPYEGFWYSHMGWVLDNKTTLERVGARGNVGDMSKDPFYKFIEKTYPIHPMLAAIGFYAWGGLPFLIWGVALRAVWVYHVTWLVNSASHVWGTQAWNTGDLSRNNWWVALLAFGEGWHNNHHAFEYSARHGLEWWQLDLTWYCIVALEKMGLATKVKLPLKDHMSRLALKSY